MSGLTLFDTVEVDRDALTARVARALWEHEPVWRRCEAAYMKQAAVAVTALLGDE